MAFVAAHETAYVFDVESNSQAPLGRVIANRLGDGSLTSVRFAIRLAHKGVFCSPMVICAAIGATLANG
jgi:hypothetical protein